MQLELPPKLTQNPKKSLSDAEVGEDVVEGFLGSDGAAGDVGERGEGKAEILGDEVCR